MKRDLSTWPRCAKCVKPVDHYAVENNLTKDAIIVHAQCHGKREAKELSGLATELLMQPLEMFNE